MALVLSNEHTNVARGRISQVFKFLEAFNQLRNPVKRLVNEQPWVLWLNDIPDHPSIYKNLFRSVTAETENDVLQRNSEVVLKVGRPHITRGPAPPGEIADWLLTGWDDVSATAQVQSTRNEEGEDGTRVIRFDESLDRLNALEEWRALRDEWIQNEMPAREALSLFERLYSLHGQLDREAERLELVLGDGILNWQRPEGGVDHPVLILRLQLEFDPTVPEFTISEADRPVELYSALFRTMEDVDGRAIGRCIQELENATFHPLGGDDTSGFLQRLVAQLSARGEFIGETRPEGHTADPRIGRAPVAFLRARNLGFATAIEDILNDIPGSGHLPSSLTQLVGFEVPNDIQYKDGQGLPVIANEDRDILLSKPANLEQLRIAQRLTQFGSALVQGPPGTGKTHTIGNLIGHLLAQGKSILVTSHTTKALRMVRDQVVEDLRPLCVSVLERDATSREQLAKSVRTIVARTSEDPVGLESQAEDLVAHRRNLINRLDEARNRLLLARGDEYRGIVVNGISYDPSKAARFVADRSNEDGWIPGPIAQGDALPLTTQELLELYQTNQQLTPGDEKEIISGIPELSDACEPAKIELLVEDLEKLSQKQLDLRVDLWESPPYAHNSQLVEEIFQQANRIAEPLRTGELWRISAIKAGYLGGPYREPWDLLLRDVEQVTDESARAQEQLLRHDPRIAQDVPRYDQIQLFEEIHLHINNGGSLGWWTMLRHRGWKKLISKVSVGSETPRHADHFQALNILARLSNAREGLAGLWQRLGEPLGLPPVTDMGEQPEFAMTQFRQPILDSLSWYERLFKPFLSELRSCGFKWDGLLSEVPPNVGSNGEILRIREAVVDGLLPILSSRARHCRRLLLVEELDELSRRIKGQGKAQRTSQTAADLIDAIQNNDCLGYRRSYEQLVNLNRSREAFDAREGWLQRLNASAPAWAAAIRDRQGPHSAPNPPGDPAEAWLWRQLGEELDRRSRDSLNVLQQQIADLTRELQITTATLVEKRAWAVQIRRTTLEQRQALTGWLQMDRRIGSGTGRYAPKRQAEARRLLSRCQNAVPVWIMPLARVVENFTPSTSQFDVVIIDEASQADIMGLIALYMGKQVIVVGDNEQVSPDAVGLNQAQVHHLQEQFLRGIPNAALYDGQTSVYDLAQQCFGGVTRLVEHFRCVPEIIQFSNHLSYNMEIKPLRDTSQVLLKPHVIAYRVEGAESERRINNLESRAVASLVISAMEQPEYQVNSKGDPVTFGVISLVGDEQAVEIEQVLRRHLPPIEYDRRRITCGNAAHFQGDERDVIFLSVVDAPSGNGPLALRAEGANAMFKRRYNVAASRARDQMWVIHSLDARVDLQNGDIRRRLIEHAEDPLALMRLIELGEQNTESEFERMVLTRLINAGYRVTPQWPVGYYRIDLVVESDGKQVAIECDGDRYHPPEKLAEDLGRQAILERLGWTFLRIRGSQFFRDPELAMQSVFVQLESIGIRPQSGGGPDHDAKPQESELRDRVAQRAAEIRREWEIGSDGSSDWLQQGVQRGSARPGGLNQVVRPTQTSWHSTPDVAEESNSIGESNEVKTVVPIGRTAGEQAQNVPSGVRDGLVENPEEVVVPGQTAWHPNSNEGRLEPQQTSIGLSENEARRKLINLRESTIRQKYGHTAPEKGILRRNMLNALLAHKPTSHEEFIAKIPHSLRLNTDQDQLDEYLNSILEIIRQIADNADSS